MTTHMPSGDSRTSTTAEKLPRLVRVAVALGILLLFPWIALFGALRYSLPLVLFPYAVVPLVLGLAALRKHRDHDRGRRWARLALILAVAGLVLQIVFVFRVSQTRHMWDHLLRRPHYLEPTSELDGIVQGAKRHAGQAQAPGSGRNHAFPTGDTGWTPPTPCCKSPTRPRCHSSEHDWRHPIWKALHFTMEGKTHYCQYRYAGTGARVSITARCDLDCDGIFGTYEFVTRDLPDGLAFSGPIVTNDLE